MDEFFSLDLRLDYSQNPDIVHSIHIYQYKQ